MLALPSSRLLRSHHFPKILLHKTAIHTQNPTKFRSTSLTVVSPFRQMLIHSMIGLLANCLAEHVASAFSRATRIASPTFRKSYLACVAPQAILFDIEATLCDSDPFHYYAYHEMLQELGFNGGVPITEEFFSEKITGGHNEYLCGILFPECYADRLKNKA